MREGEGTKRRRKRGERREEEREKERNEKHKDKTSDGLEPIFKYQTLHWCVLDVVCAYPFGVKGVKAGVDGLCSAMVAVRRGCFSIGLCSSNGNGSTK